MLSLLTLSSNDQLPPMQLEEMQPQLIPEMGPPQPTCLLEATQFYPLDIMSLLRLGIMATAAATIVRLVLAQTEPTLPPIQWPGTP